MLPAIYPLRLKPTKTEIKSVITHYSPPWSLTKSDGEVTPQGSVRAIKRIPAALVLTPTPFFSEHYPPSSGKMNWQFVSAGLDVGVTSLDLSGAGERRESSSGLHMAWIPELSTHVILTLTPNPPPPPPVFLCCYIRQGRNKLHVFLFPSFMSLPKASCCFLSTVSSIDVKWFIFYTTQSI